MKKITLFFLVIFSSSAFADTVVFKGVIDLIAPKTPDMAVVLTAPGNPAPAASPTSPTDSQSKIIVTIAMSTALPAAGTMTNASHVDQSDPAKPVAICEYDYAFPSSTVTLSLSLENGTVIDSGSADSTFNGAVFTDSPSTPNISLCQPQPAAKYPVKGTLNVTLGALKNFAVPGGALLSFEPSPETFKNESVISLNSGDITKPILSALALTAVEGLKWNTFGTNVDSKSGVLTLLPVTP